MADCGDLIREISHPQAGSMVALRSREIGEIGRAVGVELKGSAP